MKRIKWIDVRLILMLGVMIFLYSFSTNRNQRRKIVKTEVEFTGENNPFVTHETVNNLLIQNFEGSSSFQKVQLDLNSLEHTLDQNKMIEKAEVYATIDGTLKALVTQKTPIARISSKKGSYYIDYQGEEMPLSENFTARVPLFVGEINEENNKEVVAVLRQIQEDDFLKKNITGVQLLSTGSMIMTNRDYDYRIMFGKCINIDRKFKNYKAFYQHASKDTLIDSYKLINLKFTQQVVCTK